MRSWHFVAGTTIGIQLNRATSSGFNPLFCNHCILLRSSQGPAADAYRRVFEQKGAVKVTIISASYVLINVWLGVISQKR